MRSFPSSLRGFKAGCSSQPEDCTDHRRSEERHPPPEEAVGPLVILGIDPGAATAGFGVVVLSKGKLAPAGYGAIRTPAGLPLPERLRQIYEDAHRLFERFQPDVVAVEQLFFSKNVTTAFSVGQARGVFLLCAAQRGVPVAEYAPHEVKLAVTGEGRAAKAQVAFMVRALLGLTETPRPDDAADALAIAICHAHTASTVAKLRPQLGAHALGSSLNAGEVQR